MAKMNWSKARTQTRPQPLDYRVARLGQSPRQKALDAFVAKHDLACFKCKTRKAEWAKTGHGARGPWAICAKCVRRRR
jgi:hypothetical protein